MNNMFSKSAIWVVVALLLFMLFKQFDNHSVAGGSKTIAYSELLDDVKAKRIKDVVIEGSSITATRTDDTKVRTTATMLDRGLIGDLRDNNVRFDVLRFDLSAFGGDTLASVTLNGTAAAGGGMPFLAALSVDTPTAGAVPEPATGAMMSVGFGLIGGGMLCR